MTTENKAEAQLELGKVQIRRGLISVSDKTGLFEFAQGLAQLNVHLEATSGSWRHLLHKGLASYQCWSIPGQEYLGGKVKTLNPKIWIAILANRDDKREMKELQSTGFDPIDLVVVNLYANKIDVGGYALLRAAAKNYRHVVSVCSPEDYQLVLQEMRENNCMISQDTCHKLAVKTLKYLEALARAAIELLE